MSRFLIPRDLGEALAALAEPGARVLAGGTDLMIQLRERRRAGREVPDLVVDISRLPELGRRELDAPAPYLGAGLTFGFLAGDPAMRRELPVLARAAASVGSVQVRQTATIGGNVANASPAADGVSALVALGAVAEIASAGGRRFCPVPEVIAAPGKNTLAPGELILGYRLDRLPNHRGQAFGKVGRRQAVAIARLNLAVCLAPDLKDSRFVLGACFPSPRRLSEVEDLLAAGPSGEALWREAGRLAARRFVEVCGLRSSAAYKVPAIERMGAALLAEAWAGLGGLA